MTSVPHARSRDGWIWLLGLLATAAVYLLITHVLRIKSPASMPAAEAIRQRPAAFAEARLPPGADAQAIRYGPSPRVSPFVAGPRPTISLVSLR